MKTRINENLKAASFKEVSESLTQGAASTTTADAANEAVAITLAFFKALCVAVATGYLKPFATKALSDKREIRSFLKAMNRPIVREKINL